MSVCPAAARPPQVLRLEPRSKWAFLQPMQASGAPAPREVIVLRCITDRVRVAGWLPAYTEARSRRRPGARAVIALRGVLPFHSADGQPIRPHPFPRLLLAAPTLSRQSLLRFVCEAAQRQADPRLAGRALAPFYAVLCCELLARVKAVDEPLLT